MEILVITWNFPPRRGGMEALLSNLCSGLTKRHSVYVVTAYAASPDAAEETVSRAPLPGLLAFFLYALWRAARLLYRNPEIEIVFGGSASVTPLVLLLARWFARMAAVQVHGLDLVYPHAWYQLTCVRWLKYCDRVIANSSFTAALVEKRRVRQNSISIIPPGVYSDQFLAPSLGELTRHKRRLTQKCILLFVGRLTRRKGVREFIQNCLPGIIDEIPNTCLVIAGDNARDSLTHHDDGLGNIADAISAANLNSHIQLAGAVEDGELIGLYQACDVVVLPALALKDDVEGFGIVLLEAAAAKKPVVATQVGGIPDAVVNGKSGILVSAGDYGAMTQAIVQLLNNKPMRMNLGAYARRRVEEQFTWDRITGCYEAVFESLAGAKSMED